MQDPATGQPPPTPVTGAYVTRATGETAETGSRVAAAAYLIKHAGTTALMRAAR